MYENHSDNGTNQASGGGYPADRTTLLEVGGWRLVKSRYPDITGVASYPYHITCNSGVYRTADELSNGKCAKCGIKVPSEIQGLWALHNWKVITK